MVGRGDSPIEAFSFPGTFASSGVLDIATLSDNLPDLVADLVRFDPFALASKIGALLTEPTMHANTFRLEALIHLGVLHCNGVTKPRRRHLAKWLNHDLAAIASQEDPPEDVFVSNVCDEQGNYRIFEGVWETGDAYLQRVLDLLATLPTESEVHELWRNIRALLRISDVAAARRGLARYAPGGGKPAQPIVLPSDERLQRSARTTAFSQKDLADLDISIPDLAPFMLDLTRRHVLLSESIGHSTLERRPLLAKGERIVLALPTGTSAALRRFVLEWVDERGLLPSFSENLRRREIRAVLDDGMTRFHAAPLGELPPLDGPSHHRFSQAFGTFDLGKFVHILLMHDDVGEILVSGLVGDQCPPSEATEALGRHVRSASEHFSNRSEYTGGLTLMIMGGLGRGCAFGFTEATPANWHMAGLSLADFLLLSWEEDMSLLKLWKMEQQSDELSRLGVEFFNLSGPANLYQFWKNQDFNLIPTDFPLCNYKRHGLASVASNFISDLRREVRVGYDEHAAPLPNGE